MTRKALTPRMENAAGLTLREGCKAWLRDFGLDAAEIEKEGNDLATFLHAHVGILKQMSPTRRDSLAYNSYMRRYMRQKRAEAKVSATP